MNDKKRKMRVWYSEEIANELHELWGKWMRHLFKQGTLLENGSFLIPPSWVERWDRQMRTSYWDLPPGEKRGDTKLAEEFIERLNELAKRPWN